MEIKPYRIALIGNGKTGKFVAEILGDNCTVFNRSHPPTTEKLQQHDAIICFVPADALPSLLPIMIESLRPAVVGTTGFDNWESMDLVLKNRQLKWVVGTNFAMGMSLIYHMIKTLAQGAHLFEQHAFSLHEIHHAKKVDSPSGTALSWAEWLDQRISITSERVGDVVGTHQLTLNTPSEKIVLEHQSLDRKVFARGAIWASQQLLSNDKTNYGITKFEELTREAVFEKTI